MELSYCCKEVCHARSLWTPPLPLLQLGWTWVHKVKVIYDVQENVSPADWHLTHKLTL